MSAIADTAYPQIVDIAPVRERLDTKCNIKPKR